MDGDRGDEEVTQVGLGCEDDADMRAIECVVCAMGCVLRACVYCAERCGEVSGKRDLVDFELDCQWTGG